jgi:hypothetical protein
MKWASYSLAAIVPLLACPRCGHAHPNALAPGAAQLVLARDQAPALPAYLATHLPGDGTDLKIVQNYVSEIDPQFEYNRYMRAFLTDNPELSSKDAMRHWKLKRSQRGTNEYERKDLEMK